MSRPYSKTNRRGNQNPQHSPRASCGGRDSADGSAMSAATNPLVILMKLIIEKYSERVQLSPTTLNLSNLTQYDELKGHIVDLNAPKTCDTLCLCLQRHFSTVDNIALDANRIRDPSVLFNAMRRHELSSQFKGLSFCGNPIQSYSFLAHLKTFPALQELRLIDTPVARDRSYQSTITKILPNLLLLDGQPVERFTLSLPWPKVPNATTGRGEGESSNGSAASSPNASAESAARLMVMEVLQRYSETVARGDLDSLASFYHPNALLSITMAGTFAVSPYRSYAVADMKEVSRLNHELTMNRNRNLLRSSTMSNTVGSKVSKGYIEVVSTLKSVLYTPKMLSQHTFDPQHVTVSEPAAAAMKTPVLLAKVHGLMEWSPRGLVSHQPVPPQGGGGGYLPANDASTPPIRRVMDRTLVFVSSPSGDAPVHNRNRVVIFSEMIHLRAYDTAPVWTPHFGDRTQKMRKTLGLPTNVVDEIIAVAENDTQCNGIAELVKMTHLKPVVAKMCLTTAENNVRSALQLFELKRETLGPEHFYSAAA